MMKEKHASKSARVGRKQAKKKQKMTDGGCFNVLPWEILYEITLMLPFTSIKALRCSSKFLYKVLTDPKFTELQLTRARGYLFTPFYKSCRGYREVHFVEQSGGDLKTSKIFEYPINIEVDKMGRFQSSGGLMCVYMTRSNCFRIFNPNIGEEIQVRDAPIFKKCRHWWFFSYSPSTKEYKILKLGLLLRNNSIESAFGAIYTVGSNIWREIKQNIPHQFFDTFTECQGNLFWMKKRSLIWFDLVSEEFHFRIERVALKSGRLINMGHTIGCIQNDYILWRLENRTKGIWVRMHKFPRLLRYRNLQIAGVLENGSLFAFEGRSNNMLIKDMGCEDITVMKIRDLDKDFDKDFESIAYVAPHVRSFVSPVKIMEMGKKQVYDEHCDVEDISHEKKWVLDKLMLGNDATEDELFHRMYEVLQLQAFTKRRKLKRR